MSRYLVIIEQSATGYSAYSPDLPGCIATGGTRSELDANMREAVALHVDGLKLEGSRCPCRAEYYLVEV